jgi:peptidoglycan/LPS O-acetylase OafA/YrhL
MGERDLMKLRRLAGLDALRAIAALTVFAGHALSLGPAVSRVTFAGVTMFFVLSGYLLYRPFVVASRAGASVDVGIYFVRRFLRIAPAYVVALVGISVLTTGMLPGDPIGHLLMVDTAPIGVAWTLRIEAWFYLVLPLLAAAIARYSPEEQPSLLISIASLSIIAGVLFVVAAQAEGTVADSVQLQQLPFYLWAFIPGMFLATIEVDRPSALAQLRSRRWLGLAAGLLIAGGVLDLNLPFLLNGRDAVLTSVGAAILVGAALTQELGRWTRPAVIGGALSYAFYLWHVDVVAVLNNMSLIGGLEAFAVTAVIAAMSYVLVERHGLRLASAIERRMRAARAASTGV